MQNFESRLQRLERQNRTMRLMLAVGAVVLLGLLAVPVMARQQPATVDAIRARTIFVEDAQGRPRIILGGLDAQNDTRRIGMRINDERGVERFGVSLMNNGQMGMGFDAPPGTGDDRNRERINIAADPSGGAYIRFLDRRTWVAARMYLDPANQVWMEFSDFTQDPTVRRRVGLSGEETIRATKAP